MTRDLFAQVLPVLVQFALLLLAPLVAMAAQRLLKKLHLEQYQSAVSTLGQIAQVLVERSSQTVVADLKDPSKDGTWTEAAAKAVKTAVLSELKTLGRSSLETLRGQGHTDRELGLLLDALLESAVHRCKADEPMVLEAAELQTNAKGGES